MGSDWKDVTWGDILTLNYGKSLKGYRESSGPIPVYGSNGAVGLTEKSLATGPGVILGRKGAYRGIEYCKSDFNVIDTAYFVSPIIELDIQWLYYAMKGYKVGEIDDGSPIPSTTRSAVYISELHLPPLPEQKRIAHILGSLDDKIELNRKMNATLEAMAQALFKSWFVDFDPVIDNALRAGNHIPEPLQQRAETRRKTLGERSSSCVTTSKDGAGAPSLPDPHSHLFPATFTHSEDLGWIPEGWSQEYMPEACEFREGPGVLAKDFHEDGVPLIRLAGLKNGVSLLDGCNHLDPEKVATKWSHFKLKKGDILLSSSASLGRVAEVNDEAVGAIPYTGIIGFRPLIGISNKCYLKHFLSSPLFQHQVEMMGAGSVLNHFGPTHLKKMVMIVPTIDVQDIYASFTSYSDEKASKNLMQSQTFKKLRDTLLPKLISGELRLTDAEHLTTEVTS